MLQPTLHDPGSKPLTEEEKEFDAIEGVWKQAVLRGYPLLRERGAALAEHGIDFYDASFVFRDVEETLYFDRCHFEPPGMILLVDSITERLLAGLAACAEGGSEPR